jgi:hypothetical protein
MPFAADTTKDVEGPQPLKTDGLGCDRKQRSHLEALLDASPASAFRTSDWEIPNCLAICDGLTPALKVARTAFNFPSVNGTSTALTCRLREDVSVGDERFLV